MLSDCDADLSGSLVIAAHGTRLSAWAFLEAFLLPMTEGKWQGGS